MASEVEKVPVWRLTDEGASSFEDAVAREFPLTIFLNDRELVTLLCSPTDIRYLAIGFLSSEGLIARKDEVKKILVDEVRGVVRVETTEPKTETDEVFRRFISSGCGRGASFYSPTDVTGMKRVESTFRVQFSDIMSLMKEFQRRSDLYRATGGVHAAALCDGAEVKVFAEDVGRHNAVDKVFGKCLLEDISTEDRIVATSGRISSEILLKVSRRGIPIIASKSAPTDLGVRLARDLGITLLGFVRGKRMNVYTHDWRVRDAR